MKNPNINNEPPAIIPYLIVSDVKAAVEFYQRAFSFELAGEPLYEDNKMIFAAMKFKNSMIMIGQEGKLGVADASPKNLGVASPVGIYVYVDNVDNFFKHAVAAGAEIVYAPENKSWNERVCKLKDPDQHIWGFASAIK